MDPVRDRRCLMKYAFIILTILTFCSGGCSNDTDQQKYEITDGLTRFPELECYDLDDNKDILSHQNGEILVLNLWGITCTPCLLEIPELNKLVDTFKDRSDIRFIALTSYETAKEKLKKVIKKRNFKFEHKRLKRHIWRKLTGRMIPVTIICDQRGVIMYYIEGTRPNMYAYINKIITNLLNGGILTR